MLHSIEKGTPSVFVVTSPFQALCAIAAKRQFEINEYLMLAIMGGEEDSRFEQVEFILKYYNLDYQIMQIDRLKYHQLRFKSLMFGKKMYMRIFVGDMKNPLLSYIGLCFAKNNAELIYLDDGNPTISILKGLWYPYNIPRKDLYLLKLIGKFRQIKLFKNLCTIYKNIENVNYIVSYLDLSQILMIPSNHIADIILFVGTNNVAYCNEFGLIQESFYNSLKKILTLIKQKNPLCKLVYIPHGRDDGRYTRNICTEVGWNFLRPLGTVESFVASSKIIPRTIYGFTSAALFNLKSIFKSTSVVNLLIDDSVNIEALKEYHAIASFYEENNIETYIVSLN